MRLRAGQRICSLAEVCDMDREAERIAKLRDAVFLKGCIPRAGMRPPATRSSACWPSSSSRSCTTPSSGAHPFQACC